MTDATAIQPTRVLSTADELVAQAHRRCPYSNAVRGNVAVTITVA